ncbi:MAG: thioesterase family protein [Urechidicola sp.]|nr:thioesterase family protein [Urechidicola sp.]
MKTVPENTVTHSYSLKVESHHIDELNHVNNVVYLQWVNDASEKHWAILSNNEINAKYFWVCLRHEIDYIGQAFLGDEITTQTWVGESKGVKSERYVNILKGDDLLCKAVSTWCLFDLKTRKPTRIREDVLELLSVE